MKKLLSLTLSVALLFALGAPALAAETATVDQRLAAVTAKVKTTLGLDSAAYTAFSGEPREGAVTPVWDLNWSGEDGDLAITATEGGKVLSYNLFSGASVSPEYRPSFGAAFPKLTRADAQKTAQAFLDKVLTPGVETAAFAENGADALSVTNHSFYGTVLENGLPSPFTFRVSVRVSDNTVTSFYLSGDPQNYMGGLPSATPAADGAKAGESLKANFKLRLEYVLNADVKTAILRYLPESIHEYYVDAQTGKTVDLTALEQEIWDKNLTAGEGGSSAPSAAPDTMAREEATLTEVELAGVAQMEGVLSKEQLDAAARKISALGLQKYAVSNVSYRLDKESGDVTATVQYAYKSGDSVYRRTLAMDGKSGALLGVYSSRPWKDGQKATISATAANAKAQAFLKEICPDQFAKTAPYGESSQGNSVDYSYLYAAKENGYFLPESSISLGIDGTDGSVSYYYNNYVEGLTFQSTEGIVDMSAALTAWFETYDVTLGYLAVPEKLDLSEPRWKPFIEMGHKYLYTQKLAYYLARDGWYLGVDAKSGEAVKGEERAESAITYDDLEGHWVKAQAEKLARYGVGWTDGSLKPGAELNQLDLVTLLVSTNGYRQVDDSGTDRIYELAYAMGILTKAERNDSAPVTRAQLVKLLLDSAGYGNIAGLEGIFKCGFADEASIPADCYGYAAVAQALGLVKGDKAGNFSPTRTATRAEAVSMLYNFMSR